MRRISDFISKDPALASKILKAVNSPLYGFPKRVSNVTQATILLGLDTVRSLLVSIVVIGLMRKAMVGLWEHSVATGIISGILASRRGLTNPEDYAIAGLLHDAGKVFLCMRNSTQYQEVVASATGTHLPLVLVEKSRLSFTHADVGSWVLKMWNFPVKLIDIIAHHHEPTASEKDMMGSAAVHVADMLARARGLGSVSLDAVPVVDQAAWELLKLSDDDVRDILMEAEGTFLETDELLGEGAA